MGRPQSHKNRLESMFASTGLHTHEPQAIDGLLSDYAAHLTGYTEEQLRDLSENPDKLGQHASAFFQQHADAMQDDDPRRKRKKQSARTW